jgi:hypothetical protein
MSDNDTPDDAPPTSPLDELRTPVENPHGFRGYGPLLALGLFVLLMVLLAPTVAPEEIVLVPTDEAVATSTTSTTTTSTTSTTVGAAP